MPLRDYMKGKDRFISIHGHSEFSLLDGAAKVKDIIKKAKAMGQDAVAITDHGNLFGAVKAAQAAKEAGIKHIVGSELYLAPINQSRFNKTYAKGERAYSHLVVLAKNRIGYQNLCILSSLGFSDGFYRNPRIDREVLVAHSEGLIVTTSCVGGSVPMSIWEGEFNRAESDFNWFMQTFGSDFYVELQDHGTEIEDKTFHYMREMAQKYKVPTIITTDSHYLDKEDAVTHDCLLCIGTGQWVDQPQRTFKFDGAGFHYMSEDEVVERFPNEKESIFNTGRLADKIDDEVIEFGDVKLPYFDCPTDDPEFAAWRQNKGAGKWIVM